MTPSYAVQGQYILDSSILVEVLKGRNAVLPQRIATLPSSFITPHVVAEIIYGARASTRHDARHHTQALIDHFPCLTISATIGDVAGSLEYELRSIGQMIPEGDIWVGAVAYSFQMTVVTLDGKHFPHLARLGVSTDIWR